jgi:F-type H+-transporting ATPase subunit delta
MMREERLAMRYSCVEDDSALVPMEKDLTALSMLMLEPQSELRTLLVNPAFRKEEQVAVIHDLAKAFSLHPLIQNLLLLLIEKGRVALISPIARAFSSEIDVRLLRVRAHVTSAKPLSDHELNEIVDSLRHRAGKNVVAEVEVDESAGMGVKAQIGGLVFDATLSTMLERFKRKLIDAPIH